MTLQEAKEELENIRAARLVVGRHSAHFCSMNDEIGEIVIDPKIIERWYELVRFIEENQ